MPGIPQHVVQRGNDRRPCFFTDAGRHRYLQDLREIALRERCEVHAYVLMTNHVHLLITPEAGGQVARPAGPLKIGRPRQAPINSGSAL